MQHAIWAGSHEHVRVLLEGRISLLCIVGCSLHVLSLWVQVLTGCSDVFPTNPTLWIVREFCVESAQRESIHYLPPLTHTHNCMLLQGTASVMEQNRMLLGQRGEKLSRLQEATGDLAESAAGFAEMARKLAEQEKQKTRWFG